MKPPIQQSPQQSTHKKQQNNQLFGNKQQRHTAITANASTNTSTISATATAASLLTPLAADLTQRAAILAAIQGQSILLYGAAGTGKSQTISNTIAQCFAEGKRVLFVADDPDSLQMVYQQLQAVDLADLCLPLYLIGSPASAIQPSERPDTIRRLQYFRQRLQQQIPEQPYRQSQYDEINQQIQTIQQQFEQYQQALHQPQPIGWSVYQALSAQIGQYEQPRFSLPELAVVTLDAQGLAECLNTAHEISVLIQPVAPVPQHPLSGFIGHPRAAWSPDWQQRQVSDLQAWLPLLSDLQQQVDQQFYHLGLRRAKNWRELSQQLTLIQQLYSMQQQYDVRIMHALQRITHADELQQLTQGAQIAQQIQVQQQQLYATYRDEIYAQLPQLQEGFQQALTQFWPWSYVQLFRMRGLVASYSVQARRLHRDHVWHDLQGLAEIKQKISAFDQLTHRAALLLGEEWAGLATEWTRAECLCQAWHVLHYLADRLGVDAAALVQRLEQIQTTQQRQLLDDYAVLQQLWQSLGDDILLESLHYSRLDQPLLLIEQRIQRLLAHQQLWRSWYDYQVARQRALRAGLEPALDALEQGGLLPNQFRKTVLLNIQQDWLLEHVAKTPALATFHAPHHTAILEQAQRLLRQQCYVARHVILQRHRILPEISSVLEQQIEHLSEQAIASDSLAAWLQQTQAVWQPLTPCVMTTSAGLYIPSDTNHSMADLAAQFDLVIIDLATQAASDFALAVRQQDLALMIVADQAIDTRHIRPHLGRNSKKTNTDQYLDQDMLKGLGQYHLTWHYRSRFERLFEFSNQYYYDQKNASFPNAQRHDHALQLHRIEHAEPEHLLRLAIDRIVDLALQFLQQTTPTDAQCFAILTWSVSQQHMVITALQDRMANQSTSDAAPMVWRSKVVVQSMSQISSAVHDQVLLLITAPVVDCSTPTPQQFNLALTRATCRLQVVSTIAAAQLRPSLGDAKIVQNLKDFLTYAEQADRRGYPLSREAPPWDAAFEQYIYYALIMRGWDVHTQLGASGYQIDLAVVDTADTNRYLLAIFCEGSGVRSAGLQSLDEQQRFMILRQRGWTVHQVWILDWWRDPHHEVERLHTMLVALQTKSLKQPPD